MSRHTLYIETDCPVIPVPADEYGKVRVTCRPRLWRLIRHVIRLDARTR